MDSALPRGQPDRCSSGGLSERDLFLVETMLRSNASWVIVCHNSHIVQIQPVAKPLHADSVPAWWIAYARANRLELFL